MTAPVVQDADTQSGGGAGATSYTLTYPTNLAAGDLILVFVAAGGVVTPSATGFTVILNDSSSVVLAKLSDGTETGSFTLSIGGTARNLSWRALRITGWYGGTLNAGTTSNASDGISALTSTQTNTTTPDPPSLTPAWGTADDLMFAVVTGGASGNSVTNYPTNYTNGVLDGTNTLLASARRSMTAVTTENPGTFTLGSATNATTGRAATIAIRPATAVTMADTGAGTDALAVNTVGIQADDTAAGTDALTVDTVGIQADDTGAGTDALAVNTVGIQMDDTAVGADDLPQIALSGLADESGAGADAFSVTVQLPSFDETGAGVDAFSVSTTSTITGLDETGTGADGFSIEATTSLSTGRLWIGRFVSGDPLYTMQDEIISQQQIDAAELRPNVIAVDGQEDSWTEYDGDDLVVRDTPIHAYFDVPELKSLGDVRQRAVSEEETARRANSPGGDIAWDVRYTRMDRVYWITEDGSKYETRLEGLQVEFDQGPQPFQHATVDTGLMVLCPPDEASAYLVRDLFERVTADGLGAADTGGTWVIS